jgi:uncharacterized protein
MFCKPCSSYEEGAMLDLIARRQADIAALCRRFGVRRLTLFGSAARENDFDERSSDLDFLVEFGAPEGPSLAQFLDLRTALEETLGPSVDLVMEGSVRNPFILADMEASAKLVYAT